MRVLQQTFFILFLIACVCNAYSDDVIITQEFSTAECYKPLNLSITFPNTDTITNPFNPAEVDITVAFFAPNGRMQKVKGFWDGSKWCVRFSPSDAGEWTYSVSVRGSVGNYNSNWKTFDVARGLLSGPIKCESQTTRYLTYADGTPFLGAGINRPWLIDDPVYGVAGGLDALFSDMQNSGVNILGLWLAPWDLSLQTQTTGPYSYDMTRAASLDALLEKAATYDIKIILTIWPHDSLRSPAHPYYPGFTSSTNWEYDEWGRGNAFNELSSCNDFVTDATSWEAQTRLYRYIIARYSAYESLGMWATVSEADFTDAFKNNEATFNTWHSKLVNYFKDNDEYAHPITASLSHMGSQTWSENANVDIAQLHTYNLITDTNPLYTEAANDAKHLTDTYSAPSFIGEIGTTDDAKREDLIHFSAWASYAAGSIINPMNWGDGQTFDDLPISDLAEIGRAKEFFSSQINGLSIRETQGVTPIVDLGANRAWGINATDNSLGLGYLLRLAPSVGATVSINLPFANDTYNIEWVNPFDGSLIQIDTKTVSDGTLAITTPSLPSPGTDIAWRISPNTNTIRAKIQATPETTVQHNAVNLYATSWSPNQNIVSTTWSIDDGTTYSGTAIEHVFTTAGNHDITCVIVDDTANTQTVSHTITVQSPPVIIIDNDGKCTGNAPYTAAFDASASTDDTSPPSFKWHTSAQDIYTTQSVSTFSITEITTQKMFLVATDDDENTDGVLCYATSNPVINGLSVWYSPTTTNAPVQVYLSSKEASDASYAWDFGDGISESNNTATATHAWTASGTYTLSVVATDSYANTVSTTTLIEVTGITASVSSELVINFARSKLYENRDDKIMLSCVIPSLKNYNKATSTMSITISSGTNSSIIEFPQSSQRNVRCHIVWRNSKNYAVLSKKTGELNITTSKELCADLGITIGETPTRDWNISVGIAGENWDDDITLHCKTSAGAETGRTKKERVNSEFSVLSTRAHQGREGYRLSIYGTFNPISTITPTTIDIGIGDMHRYIGNSLVYDAETKTEIPASHAVIRNSRGQWIYHAPRRKDVESIKFASLAYNTGKWEIHTGIVQLETLGIPSGATEITLPLSIRAGTFHGFANITLNRKDANSDWR